MGVVVLQIGSDPQQYNSNLCGNFKNVRQLTLPGKWLSHTSNGHAKVTLSSKTSIRSAQRF
jgi:hypothetical protein